MESYSTLLYSFLAIVAVGALLQTFKVFPTFFDTYFDWTASKMTISLILLAVSFFVLMGLLQLLIRSNRGGFGNEGFETPKVMDQWKQLSETYKLSDICALKARIEEKVFAVEKGAPPNQSTDAQARERVDKLFSEKTSSGPLNCSLLKPVDEAKDIDTFFVEIQKLPDTVLIQAHETAERMYSLLQKQSGDLTNALDKKDAVGKEEGFVDPSVGICSPEIVEERRKFLRQKKLDEQAQRCLLPEEVPLESKEDVAAAKLKKFQDTYDAYIRMSPGKALINTLLTDSLEIEKKLDETKQKAEAGTLLPQV